MGSNLVYITWATARNPGAIGLLQMHGPGVRDLLRLVTKVRDWPLARLRLVDFAGIDRGMAVMLRDDWAQVMPHGGPRVLQKLTECLIESGAIYETEPRARALYPEANSDLEADMLVALARAASPRAIDLLLAQPSRWRSWLTKQSSTPVELLAHNDALDRLIDPPSVVVVGQPNVGKSTLTNLLLGRSASIVADLPGTTRDWVAGLAELDGVAVRWMDTPGLRDADDPIEQVAIELARQVIEQADVLIAMRDLTADFPDPATLPRYPDLHLINKIDLAADADVGNGLAISARCGLGIDRLRRHILEKLGLSGISDELPWAFSPTLRTALRAGDVARIRVYCTS